MGADEADERVIHVLGDLIADLSLRIEAFPVSSGEMQRVDFLDLGPGGATNVAITAARLGLQVSHLGEVGDDRFGDLVLEDLVSEGIRVHQVVTTAGAQTPVAGVVVDPTGEPAYLGHRGSLELRSLPESWSQAIRNSEAIFADGWADNEHVPGIILDGLRAANVAGVPSFFDPGPGNAEFDRGWHLEAAELASVILLTADESRQLIGKADPESAARELLDRGPTLVATKFGAGGCQLASEHQTLTFPAYPVKPVDLTGAGDCFDGAIIYAFLKGLPMQSIGIVANAAGAAKVQKLGTGLNMPTVEEVQAVLDRFESGSVSVL